MTGPRGANGASPFMYAQPERDIDSAPQAIPTPRSPALMACASITVALSDDAQNRLMVAPATLSGNPAARADQRPRSPIPWGPGLTHPATPPSTGSRPIPPRSQAPVLPMPSRSSGQIRNSEPPYR